MRDKAAHPLVCMIACGVLFVCAAGPANAETFKLTSLDWPPYSGEALDEGGLSVKVARAAFEAAGHSMEVVFLPWQRAVATGLGEGYVGYFPEYYSPELAEEKCAFSAKMGSGPLGFVESTSAPVEWTTLDDLAGLEIGTVSGYVNTPEFDARAADGRLSVQPANDDLTNVRKVAAGRLDIAVIDSNVLRWLVDQNPDLDGQVQMNGTLLADKELFVCFQKSPAGDAAREAFNAGLGQIDVPALMSGN